MAEFIAFTYSRVITRDALKLGLERESSLPKPISQKGTLKDRAVDDVIALLDMMISDTSNGNKTDL